MILHGPESWIPGEASGPTVWEEGRQGSSTFIHLPDMLYVRHLGYARDQTVNRKAPVACWGLVRKTKELSTSRACTENGKEMCQCLCEIL